MIKRVIKSFIPSKPLTIMGDWRELIEKEGIRFEAKRCSDKLPNEFWPTYSAFANTFGGRIILGLSEDENDRSKLIPTGIKNPDKITRDLWDQINNIQKVSINILSDDDVKVIDADGKKLIVIDVPRAEREKRPVYINGNMNNGTYRRNGEGDYHCSMSEIAEMVRDSRENPLDSTLCSRVKISDIDEQSLREYRQMMSNLTPSHVWTALPDDEFLRVIGAADEKEDGTLCPTMAGLLMFFRDYMITKELPRYSLDLFQYNDNEEDWKKRLSTDTGNWPGNLFSFVMAASEILQNNTPQPFALNGMVRIDDNDQIKAERELIMNGLIHADYDGIGGVRVELRPHSLKVRNPGTLRVPVNKIMKGGYSDPRNPNLMKMFRLIGLVDRAGSGIPRVISTCNRLGIPIPEIEEEIDPTTVIVTAQRDLGLRVKTVSTNVDDQRILDYISSHGEDSLKTIAENLNMSTSTLSRHIKNLREGGRLERTGSKKKGKWIVR